MDAIISGRAGRAVVFDGEQWLSVGLDRDAEPRRCSAGDAHILSSDARDLVRVTDTTLEAVRERLSLARDQDDALQLALFTLDGELSIETRREAVRVLQHQLARPELRGFVRDVLFSHPAPASADLAGATKLAVDMLAARVVALLLAVTQWQPRIEAVWRAWHALAEEGAFGDEDERADTCAAFVRAGMFRALVTGDAIAQMAVLARPELAFVPRVREKLEALRKAVPRGERASRRRRYAIRTQPPLEARDEPPKTDSWVTVQYATSEPLADHGLEPHEKPRISGSVTLHVSRAPTRDARGRRTKLTESE